MTSMVNSLPNINKPLYLLNISYKNSSVLLLTICYCFFLFTNHRLQLSFYSNSVTTEILNTLRSSYASEKKIQNNTRALQLYVQNVCLLATKASLISLSRQDSLHSIWLLSKTLQTQLIHILRCILSIRALATLTLPLVFGLVQGF